MSERIKALKALAAKKYPDGMDQSLVDRYRLKEYATLVAEFAPKSDRRT